MKDRFRQIIENADGNYVETNPERINVMLSRDEKLSAASRCEKLTIEILEKFEKWRIKNNWNYSSEQKRYAKTTWLKSSGKDSLMRKVEYCKSTRELIAKFLSDYTHNSTI